MKQMSFLVKSYEREIPFEPLGIQPGKETQLWCARNMNHTEKQDRVGLLGCGHAGVVSQGTELTGQSRHLVLRPDL